MEYRDEKDTLGEINVPADKLWGAQTQRSLQYFKIGDRPMPFEIIKGLALGKRAAAMANYHLGALSEEKCKLISQVCDEISDDKLNEHFPLAIWQTGSGTQTNMNVNEVIANRGEILKKGKIESNARFLSPNDDVNMSQSTNDMFPTAMRIAVAKIIFSKTIPALDDFIITLKEKRESFKDIKKIGRTHLMDATPLTLGDEFSSYQAQMEHGLEAIRNALPHLLELPIGGTAVGTGLNTPNGYDALSVRFLQQFTGLPFTVSENKFEAMATHDSLVELSGALKRVATSCMKIANDIRLLGSGPRSGLGELNLPANEPGSSIMPGKVNPTQCEALSMVSAQVIGNDVAISSGAMQGHLQLNVFMPLIGWNTIESASLLTDAIHSFNHNCIKGIEPNKNNINRHLQNSLMLVTSLNPHIGYYNAAKIAQYAHQKDLTLKQAALELKLVSEEDFDRWIKL